MSIIAFHFNNNLIYAFLVPLAIIPKQFLNLIFISIPQAISFSLLFSSIGYLLSLIPFLINFLSSYLKRKSSSKLPESKEEQRFIEKKYLRSSTELDIKSNWVAFPLFVILCILSTAIPLLEAELIKTQLWDYLNPLQIMLTIYVIIFLQTLITRTKIERHHALALGMMVLVTIIMIIILYMVIKEMELSFMVILPFIIFAYMEALREVIEKQLMIRKISNKHATSPFVLMIIEGTFGVIVSIFLLIFLPSDYTLPQIWTNYYVNFTNYFFIQKMEWANCYIFILFSLASFIVGHFRLKSNELMEPIARFCFGSLNGLLIVIPFVFLIIGFIVIKSSETGEPEENEIFIKILLFLFALIRNQFFLLQENLEDNLSIILASLNLVICIIWLLSTAIFNEIIVLTFCGLDKNTKERIRIRENREMELANIEPSLEDYYEDLE